MNENNLPLNIHIVSGRNKTTNRTTFESYRVIHTILKSHNKVPSSREKDMPDHQFNSKQRRVSNHPYMSSSTDRKMLSSQKHQRNQSRLLSSLVHLSPENDKKNNNLRIDLNGFKQHGMDLAKTQETIQNKVHFHSQRKIRADQQAGACKSKTQFQQHHISKKSKRKTKEVRQQNQNAIKNDN